MVSLSLFPPRFRLVLPPLDSFFRSVARFLPPSLAEKKRRKFSYGIPARVCRSASNIALVPTLSALRPLGSLRAPSIPCFLPTCNLWCRIGVLCFVAALIIVTFFPQLDIWVSIGPATASLHFRCEEVLISISFSPSLENEDGRP